MDTRIDLYNCHSGTHVLSTYSQKYGVDNICHSFEEDKILHSSTAGNDAIRYLCFANNSYLRYFVGHSKKVIYGPRISFIFSGFFGKKKTIMLRLYPSVSLP